jgi:hypothetical protein
VLFLRSEAREVLSSETARVHIASRRRGGCVAAHGARAANRQGLAYRLAPTGKQPTRSESRFPSQLYIFADEVIEGGASSSRCSAALPHGRSQYARSKRERRRGGQK